MSIKDTANLAKPEVVEPINPSPAGRRRIYFADLTHTAQGVSAATFPLGVSFVFAHARRELPDCFECKLFKMPDKLAGAIAAAPPHMLCFSNYSWNMRLSYKIAELAKRRHPGTVVVFGGPNFPSVAEEQADYLRENTAIDFYVQMEGEFALVELVRRLDSVNYDAALLKSTGARILNTVYVWNGSAVAGPVERIQDVNAIPSPYLSGCLDEFFDSPLVPMMETTRGCPFSCTFCADGLAVKNRVARFNPQRVHDELWYIARHVKGVDELIITDLNFAMYEQDVETAKAIAQVREAFNWPITISASAGKNKPKRTIEVASLLGGAWTMGASIQSTDPEVLKSIRRSNISSAAYKELIDYGNSLKNSKTHSEIILGLPGDTKEKHFASLRFGVENRVNSMRMFQAMLLCGTEMASQHDRAKFGLVTRFRTVPGCVGIYEFFGERHAVAEIEEIIVGSNTMPFEDYMECRMMNLVVETFYNNAMFDEVFSVLRAFGVSVFDCLLHIKDTAPGFNPAIKAVFDDFAIQTGKDIFPTFQEAANFVLTPEIVERYIGGELGINELLVSKARLFCEFKIITQLVFAAACELLRRKGALDQRLQQFMLELEQFVLHRKCDALTDIDRVSTARFNFNFKQIYDGEEVDVEKLKLPADPVDYTFFHGAAQKTHILNQRAIYANTPIGLGRMIQRSNLKLMYRQYKETKLEEHSP
jgi:hypothetical protein